MSNFNLGPTNRDELAEYCLRKLGKPVIEINCDPDQVQDRIDDALKTFWEYHFEGTERIYFKFQITPFNRAGSLYQILIKDGGNSYSNSDTIVVTRTGGGGGEATTSLVTDDDGVITTVNVLSAGGGYFTEPLISVTTSTGSGANLQAVVGGFIPLPDNIIGAVRVFSIGGLSISTNDIFNIRYQIALNDLYTLTSQTMVPYFMAMTHVSLLEELLVGQIPIRYNKHKNRLYLDTDWRKVVDGNWLIVEAYEIVDPDDFTKVWADRWLQMYATALIKKQWGSNLTKFIGMSLPGGVQFNGQKIYDDAVAELADLDHQLINSFSLPVADMVG